MVYVFPYTGIYNEYIFIVVFVPNRLPNFVLLLMSLLFYIIHSLQSPRIQLKKKKLGYVHAIMAI
jgi:hypothetical protein